MTELNTATATPLDVIRHAMQMDKLGLIAALDARVSQALDAASDLLTDESEARGHTIIAGQYQTAKGLIIRDEPEKLWDEEDRAVAARTFNEAATLLQLDKDAIAHIWNGHLGWKPNTPDPMEAAFDAWLDKYPSHRDHGFTAMCAFKAGWGAARAWPY